VVRQGSAKALYVGSIPTLASLNFKELAVLNCRDNWSVGKFGAESGDFGDGEGFVDGGGDVGLGTRRESEGEEAALEFGSGLGGESGDGGADIGQDVGLAEEGDRLCVCAAGDEEGVVGVAGDVGVDAGRGRRRGESRGLRDAGRGKARSGAGFGFGRRGFGGRWRSDAGCSGGDGWRRCGDFWHRGASGEGKCRESGHEGSLARHVCEPIMRAMFRPLVMTRKVRWAAVLLATGLTGCDLLTVSQSGRNIREGNEAVLRGEFQRAVQNYESALDGTMLSAEAHYRLGLVYEDQLKNQVAALHHFERYLELAPQGQFATDVKGYVDRLRLVMVSSLAEGTVLPARDASRLKNENLELRQQLADLRDKQPAARVAPTPAPRAMATPTMVVAATPPPLPAEETPEPEPEVRRAIPVMPAAATAGATTIAPVAAATPVPTPTGPRSHTVVSGDTLAKMARKYYGNAGQWPKILEANKGTLEDPTKLMIGMVLVIPE